MTTHPLSTGELLVIELLNRSEARGMAGLKNASSIAAGLKDDLGKSRVYTALDALAEGGFITPKAAWPAEGITLTEAGRRERAAIAAANAVRSGEALSFEVTSGPSQGAHTLRLDQILRSPLNPRRHFDMVALAELADSIAKAGLLQNLVVRALPASDAELTRHKEGLPLYEIVAGERRWRALNLLADKGEIPADHPVPVRIAELTDEEALMLAITENAQRQDVHPLDEGEAFQALYERTKAAGGDHEHVAGRIAAETGMTRRWVEKRMALARRLAEPVRQAFREGQITLAQAQALSIAGAARQEAALKTVISGDRNWRTADQITAEINRTAVPLDHAWFPAEDWEKAGGGYVGDGKDRKFDDKDLFLKLQKKAIGDRVKQIKTQRAFVETQQYYSSWRYDQADPETPAAETGCIIVPASAWDTKTYLHDRLIPAPARQAAAKPAEPPLYTRDHPKWAAAKKTDALQEALCDRPHVLLAHAALRNLLPQHSSSRGSAYNEARARVRTQLIPLIAPDHLFFDRREHESSGAENWQIKAEQAYPMLRERDIPPDALRTLAEHFKALSAECYTVPNPVIALLALQFHVREPFDWEEFEDMGDGWHDYTLAELCDFPAIDPRAVLDETYGEIASPALKRKLAEEAGVPDEERAKLEEALKNDMPFARGYFGEWLLEHATKPIVLPELAWRAPSPEADAADEESEYYDDEDLDDEESAA